MGSGAAGLGLLTGSRQRKCCGSCRHSTPSGTTWRKSVPVSLCRNVLDPREFWKKAASYPESKEDYYPEHAAVQEFNQYTGKRVLEYGCGGGSDALSYLRRGNTVAYLDIVPSNVIVTSPRIEAAGDGE